MVYMSKLIKIASIPISLRSRCISSTTHHTTMISSRSLHLIMFALPPAYLLCNASWRAREAMSWPSQQLGGGAALPLLMSTSTCFSWKCFEATETLRTRGIPFNCATRSDVGKRELPSSSRGTELHIGQNIIIQRVQKSTEVMQASIEA